MATYSSIRYNFPVVNSSTSSQIGAGAMKLIKTLTADEDANLSLVGGSSDVVLDNTYRTYIIKYINMHPETDSGYFQFSVSTDGGSNYGIATTSTGFRAAHTEDGTTHASLAYDTSYDLSQETGAQTLKYAVGGPSANDACGSGELWLFNPSQTTYVKHFLNVSNGERGDAICFNDYTAGYFNTTSAINALQFSFNNGDIDAGTIKLYGIA